MSTFARTFRAIVGPRLRERCYVHGVLIAVGSETFCAAQGTVMREAITRGAAYLDNKLLGDLEDNVATWLVEAAEKARPKWEAAHERARRIPRCARCGFAAESWAAKCDRCAGPIAAGVLS